MTTHSQVIHQEFPDDFLVIPHSQEIYREFPRNSPRGPIYCKILSLGIPLGIPRQEFSRTILRNISMGNIQLIPLTVLSVVYWWSFLLEPCAGLNWRHTFLFWPLTWLWYYLYCALKIKYVCINYNWWWDKTDSSVFKTQYLA